MSKLYCPECNSYLMAGDGECHDCGCGWRQYRPVLKTFEVVITVDASITVRVEAEDEASAKEKAFNECASPSVCNQCSREVFVGEPLEAVEAVEVDND